jgi:hypothetical protein
MYSRAKDFKKPGGRGLSNFDAARHYRLIEAAKEMWFGGVQNTDCFIVRLCFFP